MKINEIKKTYWIVLLFLVVVLIVLYLFVIKSTDKKIQAGIDVSPFTDRCLLHRPDVLIRTKSISSLVDDIKKIPYLKEFFESAVWEDIEQSEARLSLNGTLYRIAFEHDLKIEDVFFKSLFEVPAEVGLWGGYHGKIKDVMIIMPSSLPGDFLLKMTKVAADDSQVSKVVLYTKDQTKVDGVKIDYAHQRSLYLASYKGYLYALSNSSCALPTEKPDDVVKKNWSGYPKDISLLTKHYNLLDDDVSQEITVSFRYLSGGYSSLIDQIDAVRFFYDDHTWKANVFLKDNNASLLPASVGFWKIMPHDAPLCIQLPARTDQVIKVMGQLYYKYKSAVSGASVSKKLDAEYWEDFPKLKKMAQRVPYKNFSMCWLENSSYLAPVFVVSQENEFTDDILKLAFERFVGNRENIADKKGSPLPWLVEENSGVRFFMREVSSDLGDYPKEESKNGYNMLYKKYFKVAMALHKDYIIFSPEVMNVEKVVAVINKLQPSLVEILPKEQQQSSVVYQADRFSRFLTNNVSKVVSKDYQVALWSRFIPYVKVLGQKKSLSIVLGDTEEKTAALPVLVSEF